MRVPFIILPVVKLPLIVCIGESSWSGLLRMVEVNNKIITKQILSKSLLFINLSKICMGNPMNLLA